MNKVVILLLTLVAVSHGKPQGYSYPSSNSQFRPGRPSSTYGTPSSSLGPQGYKPTGAGQYPFRPPGNFGTGGFGEDNSEPANYQFQYDVNAPEYGTRFGHKESRMGDRTRGRYYVGLPDGRTQIVDYWADETGYHPTITYSY